MRYKLRNLLRTFQSAIQKCICQVTAHRVEIIQKKILTRAINSNIFM